TPALVWEGVGTALHANFPYANNATLGSRFAYADPGVTLGTQWVNNIFTPDTTFHFTGFGVDNNLNENDLLLRIGYRDDTGAFQLLAEEVIDVTGMDAWTLLDGVTYTTGHAGPELGRLVTLQVGAVQSGVATG